MQAADFQTIAQRSKALCFHGIRKYILDNPIRSSAAAHLDSISIPLTSILSDDRAAMYVIS